MVLSMNLPVKRCTESVTFMGGPLAVLLVEVTQRERCRAMRDVCGQSVFRDGYRPEQAACADSGVEVMNLADANGTGEQVHSNKGEGPVVSATVLANVEAAHESVVDLVVEPGLEAGRRVRAGSRAEDSGHTHESVEIRDLGRLVDRPRRDRRKRRKVVDEDPERRYPPDDRDRKNRG